MVLLCKLMIFYRKVLLEKQNSLKNIIYSMFGPPIPPISFHFIFSLFSILQNITFYSTFFNHFFNFPNPHTISLNLNHLYHLKICKIKLFFKPFFKLFFKPFKMVKNDQNNFPKRMVNSLKL